MRYLLMSFLFLFCCNVFSSEPEFTIERLSDNSWVAYKTEEISELYSNVSFMPTNGLKYSRQLAAIKNRAKLFLDCHVKLCLFTSFLDSLSIEDTKKVKLNGSKLLKEYYYLQGKVAYPIYIFLRNNEFKLQDVFNDATLLEAVLKSNYAIKLRSVKDFFSQKGQALSNKDKVNLKKIEFHISDTINFDSFFMPLAQGNELSWFESMVQSIDGKTLFERNYNLRLSLRTLFAHGYLLNPQHHRWFKIQLENELAEEQKDLEEAKSEEDASNISDTSYRIAAIKAQLVKYDATDKQSLTLRFWLSKLKKALSAQSIECNFDIELNALIELYKKGYPWRSLMLTEGTMCLEIDSDGEGQFFNDLLGAEALISHMKLVASNTYEGITCYYIGEILDHFKFAQINKGLEGDMFFVKPAFCVELGHMDIGNQNIINKQFGFDLMNVEGAYDSKGRVCLNCTEYSRYSFTTRLSESGEIIGKSPFDEGVRHFLPSKTFEKNLKVFGLVIKNNFKMPDDLLYSTQAVNIGYIVQDGLGKTDSASDKAFLLEERCEDEAARRIHHLLSTRELKEIGSLESVKLYASWKLINASTDKFENIEVPTTSIPYLLKLFSNWKHIEDYLDDIDEKFEDSSERQILQKDVDAEYEKFLDFLDKKMKAIDDMFLLEEGRR